MKLTKRQKTILLISGGVFLLAIFITTVAVNAGQKKIPLPSVLPKDSPSPSPTPVPIPPDASITTQRNQIIEEIETIIAN